jgi:hypothetical protein
MLLGKSGGGGMGFHSSGGGSGTNNVSGGRANGKSVVVSSGGTVEIGIRKGLSGKPKLVINPSNANANNNNNNNNNVNNNLNGIPFGSKGANQNGSPFGQILALRQAGLEPEEILASLAMSGSG